MNIQHVPNQIGDNRGTRTALGQGILMTSYLGEDRCNFGMEHEVGIFDEEASHPTKVDAWEKILQIDIGNVPSLVVFLCICDDRSKPLEPVGHIVFPLVSGVNLLDAIL